MIDFYMHQIQTIVYKLQQQHIRFIIEISEGKNRGI